ncbi:cysteine desulfurase / selenocysteine lyase [Thalassolituus maritimus]|uniref:Cysteine desulfurase / selenocysteine lyase n=1 Tax=Thalassolituus maritimus TaxID=484498 RepID=A0A1N7Q9D9_9GAMM|nr:aminotransferase class V-fold PLP-dependent enzyme [Thalassolituus maritimus]SIT19369.1 cysteine desulfurase / selenocysteine lyase [Thalassolituus maritimus]
MSICEDKKLEGLDSIRGDFPVLAREVDGRTVNYLDSAATTLKPQSVIDAVTRYYTEFTANIHRGRHRLSEEASDRYEEARYKVALLTNSASNEVIFVRNTTEAINLANHCIGLTKDDFVVCCLDNHHSHFLPWLRHGNVVLVEQTEEMQPDLEHFAELLKLKPKVVALTHCSNVTGNYIPLDVMSKMAHEAGALVVVDAAQSAAHRKLNFSESYIDFLAISSHKMLGPSGIGCLIGKADLLRDGEPMLVGGGVVDYVTADSYQYRKLPHKYEAGTPAIEASYGFGAAIDYLESIGFDRIEAHEKQLSKAFIESINNKPNLACLGQMSLENRAPIFSLYVKGVSDLSDICRALSDSYGVMCRNGHLCAQPLVDHYAGGQVIRMSAYIYNTVDEIEAALEALNSVVQSYV